MCFSKIFPLVILSIMSCGPLWACPTVIGTLAIEDPVITFYNGNIPGAGYLVIRQTGLESDRLLKVRLAAQSSEISPPPRVELHDHIPVTTNGQLVMQMVALESVDVRAATESQASVVEFRKGGMHLMLYNFPENLKNSDKLALVLTFENAGDVTVNFKVVKGASTDMKNNCSCPNHKD